MCQVKYRGRLLRGYAEEHTVKLFEKHDIPLTVRAVAKLRGVKVGSARTTMLNLQSRGILVTATKHKDGPYGFPATYKLQEVP